MEQEHDQKRKSLWVNPRFQRKFILTTLGATLAVVSVGLISNWFFVWRSIEIGNSIGLPEGHEFFKLIYKQEAMLNLTFLITSTIILVLSGVYALVMSNRIAGPIYRIQKQLEKLVEGQKIDQISVREGDYFQELAGTINTVLSKTRNSKTG